MSNSMRSRYVKVSADLELYVEESGEGRPLVFVPGWTMTTEVFAKQVAHFSSRYRVVVFDPRSQGRSSRTWGGNHFLQHGDDLDALMVALDLDEAVMLPWSYGCADVWARLRTHGASRMAACVFIDCSPCSVSEHEKGWREGGFTYLVDFQRGMVERYREYTREFCRSMWQHEPPAAELDWITDQSLRTPQHVALLLSADGATLNFTAEANSLDGKMPVMHVVHEEVEEAATRWLATYTPAARVEALGYHFMFWEHAERFNALVDDFLASNGLL